MTELGHGVVALLGDWTTYALIVSAVVGFVLQQSALRTDVLAPAMASSNAVTLFASVTFGLTVFGESLSHGHGRLVPAIIGLAHALIGIVLLAGAKPPLAAEPIPKINPEDQSHSGRPATVRWPAVAGRERREILVSSRAIVSCPGGEGCLPTSSIRRERKRALYRLTRRRDRMCSRCALCGSEDCSPRTWLAGTQLGHGSDRRHVITPDHA